MAPVCLSDVELPQIFIAYSSKVQQSEVAYITGTEDKEEEI